MPIVLSQWTHYAGLNLPPGFSPFCVVAELSRQLFHALLPFAAVHLHSFDVLCIAQSRTGFGGVALDPLHFGVHAAGLLHLAHTSMGLQFGLGAALQVTVKSFIIRVQVAE